MTGQKERILRHLNDFGEIDSMTAMQDYGIMRLASRVDELRKAGHQIITVPTLKMFEPIPADTAQKLGIEPKEGTC